MLLELTILAVSVTDPQGRAVAGAEIRTGLEVCKTNPIGQCTLRLGVGDYHLVASAPGLQPSERDVHVAESDAAVEFRFTAAASQAASMTVTADAGDDGLMTPDPAQRIMIRQETLDANPGRPGFPISIPGMPVESPAGGIKPPQYFVPGVAGDHGEPIAQFFQVGGYLFPNNLPANAHGNGYADPNILIPVAIEGVAADGGAFNVREGNNSISAATVFSLRDRIEPMLRLTADSRDVNLVAGWSPRNVAIKEWIGLEFGFGNGYLDRLEHRKQYKVNLSRAWTMGKHELTVYGIGYHGFSFLPGLIPIGVDVPGDTFDNRQREEASSGVLIVNDQWRISPRTEVQFSGYWRNYFLDVRPNFGDGLIRQTESRTGSSESALLTHRFSRQLSVLAGFDHRRDAPHNLYLYKFDEAQQRFDKITGNNLDINFLSPYFALDGGLGRYFRYDVGLRHDEVFFNNRDLLQPERSFTQSQGVNSPKATLSFLVPDRGLGVSLSYGQSFHTNDPRIGVTGDTEHTIVSKARSYQLVVRKTIAKTEFRVTLVHATTAQQLARLNNDTGLQEDRGPGIIRSAVVSARRNFGWGFVQASFAKADARDRLTGEPTPEAPRLIWDSLGTLDKLPFHLKARGEFEYVGRKPLGGLDSVPVREFRGAIFRSFETRRIDVGINFFVADGYGGQTIETLALPKEGSPFDRVTGFPLRSYATLSATYRFGRR